MDPWGNPYVFVSPGEANPNGYDLMTLGADGQPGGEGEDMDIRAWTDALTCPPSRTVPSTPAGSAAVVC